MTEGIINVEEADPADRTGVTVGERMPGFAAYRALRDGDVIIGIEQIPPLPIRSPSDLVEAIRIRRPGDTIRLRVLRGANLLSIPVVLGPRPLWAERFGREEILARQQAADAYWQRHFAGLVQRPLS
jgi:S1-C subfamily serine protease